MVKQFREDFGAVVANGQGEMKGKVFRIAHLGYYDYLDTIGILAALEHVHGGRDECASRIWRGGAGGARSVRAGMAERSRGGSPAW